MADYVTKELPSVVDKLFKVDNSKKGITGHSVGGHGALVTHFRNPGMYQSVSALAPVCNPSNCQWGKKAFEGFLGSVEAGAEYDSTLLVSKYEGPKISILVDQGTNDGFVKAGQMRTEEFYDACGKAGYPLELRW